VAQPATTSEVAGFLGESKKGGEKHTIRRIITMLTVAAILAAMLVLASPASAQGGCKEFGNAVGLVPTGKGFEALLILIHRIEGGKIAEEWSQGGGLAELTQQRLEQEIRERARVEQELLVARSIQQASLPKEVPELEGWQITPYFQPAREVGGDFYEFFELDDGRVGFAVGDATGKGVPAALVMTAICAFLGGVATASGASPGEALARVNEAALARIPANMFVTCFYAILDPKSGILRYANAGHDLSYLHRNGDAEELRAEGDALGAYAGDELRRERDRPGAGARRALLHRRAGRGA
jgi:hypothetical protein